MSETWEQAVERAMSSAPPEVREQWQRLRDPERLRPVPASNPLDAPAIGGKSPSYHELTALYFDLWGLMVQQRERAEKAEGEGGKLREALAHMQWCRPCSEGSWEACDGGRAALELPQPATGGGQAHVSALVSEEDVLARLLLEWLWDWDAKRNKEWAVPDEYLLPKEQDAQALASAVVMELECDLPLSRAIAESERRLEVDQAERAVLDAALRWGSSGVGDPSAARQLAGAVHDLWTLQGGPPR